MAVSFWKKLLPRRSKVDSVEELRQRLASFHRLQADNGRALELIAQAEEMLGGEYIFDRQSLKVLAQDLENEVRAIVRNLNAMTHDQYPELVRATDLASADVRAILESRIVVAATDDLIPIADLDISRADAVGEKMARLGEVANRLGCRIPAGFVVSAWACQRFLEDAGILEAAESAFGQPSVLSEAQVQEHADHLRTLVLGATLPRDLARAIRRGVKRLVHASGCHRFALRSSALGEDGGLSFAGQFETVLGVPPQEVLPAYKRVVASLYSPAVMRYRLDRDLHPARGLMAVGCLEMIPAIASGVAYTLDPTSPFRQVVLVSAAWGLGRMVVEGAGVVDQYEVARDSPHRLLMRSIAHKSDKYVLAADRGVDRAPVRPEDQDRPCLDEMMLTELGKTAMAIERHMRRPQDVEWALDDRDQLVILQARPLRVMPKEARPSLDLLEAVRGYPVLMRNQGIVACRGIGAGKVCILADATSSDCLGPGAVLVARTSTPRLAAIVERASAVIIDLGTVTSHLATIAREYGIPTIVDARNATAILTGGKEVTVDAEENVVYQGRVEELLKYQLIQSHSGQEAAEFKLLRGVLRRVAPLNLRDPRSANFAAHHCFTYHDIIRFAHEQAVLELIEGSRTPLARQNQRMRRLDLDIPLDLVLIDVGGGLAPGLGAKTTRLDEVSSKPLKALLRGLTGKGAWLTEPADMDLDGFMSSATRSMSLSDPSSTVVEHNLAVISDAYMNLSLRLGYHFNIVDCYLSEERNDNYIYFRFVGGVTEITRRSRRVDLLRRILEAHDFLVEVTGDLIYGRIKKIPPQGMTERLEMIGRLIGFTRQLDILLRDDSLVDKFASRFLQG
jgi:pyruvate,water dikinase